MSLLCLLSLVFWSHQRTSKIKAFIVEEMTFLSPLQLAKLAQPQSRNSLAGQPHLKVEATQETPKLMMTAQNR